MAKTPKDIFKAARQSSPNKTVASASFNSISREVESPNYVDAFLQDKNRFRPAVDFTDPANFARFGLAQEYYKKAIQNIYKTYPYDGSLQERYSWHNSSSYFDNYFLEYEYPRTNGYVTIGAYWDNSGDSVTGNDDTIKRATDAQIISIEGGPHGPTAPSWDPHYEKQITYKNAKQKANVFNLTSSQAQNLTIDGATGNSVEFWLKLPTEPSTSQISPSHAYFDLWNEGTGKTSGGTYGRFLVETRCNKSLNGAYVDDSMFHISYMSGNTGAERAPIGPITLSGTLNIDLADWNHYAFVAQNNPTGSDHLLFDLYINGNLVDSVHTGSQVSEVKDGPFNANIGSYRYQPSSEFTIGDTGYGALSGSSFDEFRFWKKARNEKDINLYWFTQIAGGTNTDVGTPNSKYSGSINPVDLGVYYKFNEGITGYTAQDKNILDYSGRVSNGLYENYSTWGTASPPRRFVGSAIVSASAADREFKDPILYNNHPDVEALSDSTAKKGIEYDVRNPMSLYNMMPGWILDDDSEKESYEVRALTQIIASYFDDLYLQTEQVPRLHDEKYISGSVSGSVYKPIPFANRLVENRGYIAPELFSMADILPSLANRDDVREFKTQLVDVKNQIYTNIYNNLTFISKAKGTEKAIRNLIRCYGIDDDIYALSFYANNSDITLNQSITPKILRKNYANFATASNFSALVYQSTASSNANSSMFITGSSDGNSGFDTEIGFTTEAEVIFPLPMSPDNPRFADTEYTPISASLFGMHSALISPAEEGNTGWAADDYASFQVYAVKENNTQLGDQYITNQVKFVLTGTNVNSTTEATFPYLTSSVFDDVYANQKWNFAVKVYPAGYPNLGFVSGTSGHTVEFHGYNTQADIVTDHFVLTGSVSSGAEVLSRKKRIYIGSHRTNFTGSLLTATNVRVSSCRHWTIPLEAKEIVSHAIDASNNGIFDPMRNAYLFQDTSAFPIAIPKIRTLVLNWDFSTLTGSDANGEMEVPDFSSGSLEDKFGTDLSKLLLTQHTGRGLFFSSSANNAISKEHVYSYKQQVPENLDISDTIRILNKDQEYFTPRTKPVKFTFGVEKSMYQTISEQMLNFLACSAEASGLETMVGNEINKYRGEYKLLGKIREIFFERIGNTPDLDKYLEFYKWMDSTIDAMVEQIVPASSEITGVKNMIESHVFERNKYTHKFPTMEFKSNELTGSIKGINELLYDWEFGHAPLDKNQDDNCLWWNKRALRDEAYLEVGNAGVDYDRRAIHSASLQVFNRRFKSPYKISGVEGGGIVKTQMNKRSVVMTETKPFNNNSVITYNTTTFSTASSACADVVKVDPNIKRKADYQVTFSNQQSKYDSGLVSPYTFFSASMESVPTGIPIPNFQAGPQHLRDYYVMSKDVPAQGPFTEQHVGGYAYRHIGLSSASADMLPPPTGVRNRPQGYFVNFALAGGNYYYTIVNPSYYGAHMPRADFTRDFIAKSPVNIKNIQTNTASLSNEYGSMLSIGNYVNDYEIVQIPGRSINNRYLVENNGIPTASITSTPVFGLKDFEVPDRGINSSIMVSRFSAPGGPEVSSPGYLDYESETFSAYNALPFRNLTVRQPLRKWLTNHSAFGGYSSVYGAPSASYQKRQRNGAKRITFSEARVYGADESIATASVYDNFWVQHMIPQSDLQYAWITASAISAPYGYEKPDPANASEASTDITFLSSSQSTSVEIYSDHGTATLAFSTDTLSSYDNQTVTIISTVGTSKVYKFTDDAAEGSTGSIHSDGSSIVVQINGMSARDDYAAQLMVAIQSANGHNGGVSNSVLELNYLTAPNYLNIRQKVPGPLVSAVLASPTFSAASSIIAVITFGSTTGGNEVPTDNKHRMFSLQPDGTLYNSSSADLSPSLIHTDFVGMNTHFVDDINLFTNTISQTTLNLDIVKGGTFPDAPYSNDAQGPVGTGSYLNAINLRRNGAGGFSSWRQVRQAYNPLVRKMAQNNIISLATASVAKFNKDSELITYRDVVRFTESPVVSSFKPLKHSVVLSNNEELIVNSTYANNLYTFASKRINNLIDFHAQTGEEVYDDLKRIYIDKDLGTFSPIKEFKSLSYREIVYPSRRFAGLAKTRGRENYTVSSGSADFNLPLGDSVAFWKDNINDRLRANTEAKTAQGQVIYSASAPMGLMDLSCWPLDAEEPFFDYYLVSGSATGNPLSGFDSYWWSPLGPSGGYLDSSIEPKWLNAAKNGELSYAGWVYTLYNFNLDGKYSLDGLGSNGTLTAVRDSGTGVGVTASFQYEYPNLVWSGSFPYGRRWMSGSTNPGTTGLSFMSNQVSGALHLIPPYRTDVLSGRKPWFNSYEDYAEDIRLMAKDYSVVPEFRISEHMDYYLNNGFYSENNKFLDLIGASLSNTSSATTETSRFQNQFFTIYSNSDFMSKFVDLKEDHKKNSTAAPTKVSLKINAIKKLLPYQGFYPALRAVQLGHLFSASYSPYISGSNTYDDDNDARMERLAALYQPFFAPGIFFNTIKSGIAVDYSVHTGSSPSSLAQISTRSGKSITKIVGVDSPYSGSNNVMSLIIESPNYSFPFESILNPDRYLPLTSSRNFNTGEELEVGTGYTSGSVYFVYPHFTGSLNTDADPAKADPWNASSGGSSAASNPRAEIYFEWKGKSDIKYSLAANNFFAEVEDFFLERRAPTSFVSKAEKDFRSVTSGSVYMMDVVLSKTNDFVSYEGPSGSFNFLPFTGSTTQFDADGSNLLGRGRVGNNKVSARGMHYGPPYLAQPKYFGSTETESAFFEDPCFAIHTPPYFYGDAVARVEFRPHEVRDMTEGESAKFTLQEILANASISTKYFNTNERAKDFENPTNIANYPAGQNQMQLSSSVDLFGSLTLKQVQYSSNRDSNGDFIAEGATTTVLQDSQDAWVIETKFECPSVNLFAMDTGSLGAAPQGNEKYMTRGIWKGYGTPPTGSDGIFLQLRESSPQRVDSTRALNAATGAPLTGSLINVCGFEADKVRVGEIASERQISEAIVAIPINSDGEFYDIEPDVFLQQLINVNNGDPAVKSGQLGVTRGDIQQTSISNMIEKIKKFYIPPQLDCVNNPTAKPIVMYIFEFNHILSKNDLSYIWQNLMPDIAMTAEKDHSVIEHSLQSRFEFFGKEGMNNNPFVGFGSDIRWMVFKAKQRGKNNYNNVTKKSERGLGFPFTTNKELEKFTSVPDRELPYSYNWPYDFFSLVELAQLETEYEFTKTLELPAAGQGVETAQLAQQQVSTTAAVAAVGAPEEDTTSVDIDIAELTRF